MKITREINGKMVEIELTRQEMSDALTECGKYWGIVRWCDEDIEARLQEDGIKATENNIGMIRTEVDDAICDYMCEAGWGVIDRAIANHSSNYWNHRSDFEK